MQGERGRDTIYTISGSNEELTRREGAQPRLTIVSLQAGGGQVALSREVSHSDFKGWLTSGTV